MRGDAVSVGREATLRLVPGPGRALGQAVGGWLLPGADAERWLAELAAVGLASDAVRSVVVARQGRGRAAGLLVLRPEGGWPHAVAAARGRGWCGYVCRAGRLYHPADAELDPAVSDEELAGHLVWPLQVWHPGLGLLGYEREAVRSVASWLAAPRPGGTRGAWDAAEPGVGLPGRLQSVTAAPAEGAGRLGQWISQSGEGIGEGKLSDAAEDEAARRGAGEAAARLRRRIGRWLEGLAARLRGDDQERNRRDDSERSSAGATGQAGGAGGGSGWLGGVASWGSRQAEALARRLGERRSEQVQRLLSMFQRDPDRALRYALPLGGGGQSRGIGRPTTDLGEREPRFDLGELGRGGGPGDAWSLPGQVYQRLQEAYREAANRELRLGRFRRAAYIFAQLLWDDQAAAQALVQGRYFREAAALYRDRLQNPRAAAECLASGGLLSEAADLYRELRDHERAGELLEQLGEIEAAQREYRQAVHRRREAGQTLETARILEQRLNAVDEAVDVLRAASEDGTHPVAAFEALCDLLGRHRRHEAVGELLGQWRRRELPSAIRFPWAQALAGLSRRYPDAVLRERMTDLVRVTAGRAISVSADGNDAAMLSLVGELEPGADPLLSPDTARYRSRSAARRLTLSVSVGAVGAAARGADGPTLVGRFSLRGGKGGVDWRRVVGDGDHFWAAGLDAAWRPLLVRGTWTGVSQLLAWPAMRDRAWTMCLEAMGGVGDGAGGGLNVLIGVWGESGPVGLEPQPMPAGAGYGGSALAGSPSWLPSDLAGLCRDELGVFWLLRVGEREPWVLERRQAEGSLMGTHVLPEWLAGTVDEAASEWEKPWPMAASGGGVAFGCGAWLVQHSVLSGHTLAASAGSQARITQLVAGGESAGGQVVAALDGADHALAWVDMDAMHVRQPDHVANVPVMEDGILVRFGSGLVRPVVGFTSGGVLVAMTQDEGRIYDGRGGGAGGARGGKAYLHRIPGPESKVLAVTPGPGPRQCGVFCHDGSVRLYQMP